MLPGPLQSSGYQTVLFIGSTGSGKTSLVRQLVGTDPAEQFPAVSSSKTTVAETEILLAPGGYYAVATFRDEPAVRIAVEECLEAALEALRSGRDLSAARRALTEHRDQLVAFLQLDADDPALLGPAVRHQG